MKEFGRNDNLLASLVLSVYVLGFGVGPTLLAPLSEFYGRVVIYHATNVLFLLFTLACGLSQDIGMLVAFRFLAGCAGAAPLAIGGGTIVDLVEVKMRGRVMTVFSMGPLLGCVFVSPSPFHRNLMFCFRVQCQYTYTIQLIYSQSGHRPCSRRRHNAKLRLASNILGSVRHQRRHNYCLSPLPVRDLR